MPWNAGALLHLAQTRSGALEQSEKKAWSVGAELQICSDRDALGGVLSAGAHYIDSRNSCLSFPHAMIKGQPKKNKQL